jgi:hypothetical protein
MLKWSRAGAALLIWLLGAYGLLAQETPEQINAVLEDLGRQVGQTLTLEDLRAWSWAGDAYSDTSLGCAKPDVSYTQVVTRGFKFILNYQGTVYDYRVSEDGNIVILCSIDEAVPPTIAPQATPTAPPAGGIIDVRYGSVEFSVDRGLASAVTPADVDLHVPAADETGFPEPEHIAFSFANYPGQTGEIVTLRVYPVETYEAVGGTQASDEINRLADILEERGSLDGQDSLPYLPLVPGDQVVYAQAVYIDFQGGAGIAYLTAFRLDVAPLTSGELIYTFQGLTDDGQYYISATFPVRTSALPETIADDFDYDAFAETFSTYLAETTEKLNDLTAADFTPRLDLLDSVVRSLVVNGN